LTTLAPSVAPSHAPAARTAKAAGPGPAWIYGYLVVQFLCQLALLFPAFVTTRIVFRAAAFGTSLLFLVFIPGSPLYKNPTRSVLLCVLGVLTVSWLNPMGGGVMASSAHWLFQLAIMAPVFWVARLYVNPRGLERMLLLIWSFSAASALVGVLQASFPGRFEPALSMVYAERGKARVQALTIELSSGDWIFRPMGLTDVPGGAGYGGFYAVLLGVGVFLARPFPGARPIAAITILAGAVSVYLCQIRALLVMLGICLIAMIAISALAGRVSRMFAVGGVVGIVGVVAFLRAVALGGRSVTGRLSTLISDDASSVYFENRGLFLENTFLELLPDYPLGTGLGRWGMMTYYFGDGSKVLWAEIQWTGWLYDGGIMLMLLYPAALGLASFLAARIALRAVDPVVRTWATIIFAYDVGAFALTFSYPNFQATAGIEYWLINAALLQAAGSVGTVASQLRARLQPRIVPQRPLGGPAVVPRPRASA
jgi:hypothetical protein